MTDDAARERHDCDGFGCSACIRAAEVWTWRAAAEIARDFACKFYTEAEHARDAGLQGHDHCKTAYSLAAALDAEAARRKDNAR